MSADTSVFAYSGVFEPFVKLSAFMTVFIASEERAKCNSQAVLSPVYTRHLNRFRMQLKLNRIALNTLVCFQNRFTW